MLQSKKIKLILKKNRLKQKIIQQTFLEWYKFYQFRILRLLIFLETQVNLISVLLEIFQMEWEYLANHKAIVTVFFNQNKKKKDKIMMRKNP